MNSSGSGKRPSPWVARGNGSTELSSSTPRENTPSHRPPRTATAKMGHLCPCRKPGAEAFLASRSLAAHRQGEAPALRCPVWAGADQEERGGHPVFNQEPFNEVLVIPANTNLPCEMPAASPLAAYHVPSGKGLFRDSGVQSVSNSHPVLFSFSIQGTPRRSSLEENEGTAFVSPSSYHSCMQGGCNWSFFPSCRIPAPFCTCGFLPEGGNWPSRSTLPRPKGRCFCFTF